MARERSTVLQPRDRQRARKDQQHASRAAHAADAQASGRAPLAAAPVESGEPSWRASSYDLKHGLDVIELPSSLPPDGLDRLFNAPR